MTIIIINILHCVYAQISPYTTTISILLSEKIFRFIVQRKKRKQDSGKTVNRITEIKLNIFAIKNVYNK